MKAKGNRRLHKFASDGRLLWAVTGQAVKGVEPRLAFDRGGNVYLIQAGVEEFDSQGRFVKEYPGVVGLVDDWVVMPDGKVSNRAVQHPVQ